LSCYILPLWFFMVLWQFFFGKKAEQQQQAACQQAPNTDSTRLDNSDVGASATTKSAKAVKSE